jgi:hypothetical protein
MVALLLILLIFSCKKEEIKYPIKYPIARGMVDEASGIADSKKNAGYLWVQQDSDNPTELALISHKGQFLKKIFLQNTSNRDWEDIQLGPGPNPSKGYIYLGDIGDNSAVFSTYFIYRFPEPDKKTDTVHNIEKISFKYPDGSHDAEAFLVEPETKDIYIITKREPQSGVYLLKYPYSAAEVNTVSFVGRLPYNNVVSASIQPDGKGVALKTYFDIKYYARGTEASIGAALQNSFTQLPYQAEIQGEAISFTLDNKGYFTLGERRFIDVSLDYYGK